MLSIAKPPYRSQTPKLSVSCMPNVGNVGRIEGVIDDNIRIYRGQRIIIMMLSRGVVVLSVMMECGGPGHYKLSLSVLPGLSCC